jgi:hypothetical protein
MYMGGRWVRTARRCTAKGVDQQNRILAWQKRQAFKAFYRQPRQISYPLCIPSPDLFVGKEHLVRKNHVITTRWTWLFSRDIRRLHISTSGNLTLKRTLVCSIPNNTTPSSTPRSRKINAKPQQPSHRSQAHPHAKQPKQQPKRAPACPSPRNQQA